MTELTAGTVFLEIGEALTHDTHFEQAGFRALMRPEL